MAYSETRETVPAEPAARSETPSGDERVPYRRITEDILGRMGASGRGYLLGLGAAGGLTLLGAAAWGYQLWKGMGVTGMSHPIMWATYITSFVWWIGVAHAGTFISAILYLFRAPFRPAFSRSAEAMTVIAILISSAFPIIHLGRAWRFYWLLPYPNQRDLWVTFRSPLILDVFAVITDLTVALLFFWLGLVPDLAILRDRAKGWARTIYGVLSLGWEGTGRQWKHYRLAYSLLAGLAVPLVISAHSIASWDFALTVVPGWHSTLLPPFFVAGAIFSGLAMVLTLSIPLRAWLGLKDQITDAHLDWIARLLLTLSLLFAFFRGMEYFMVWYGGTEIEKINMLYKASGAFAPWFWIMIVCTVLAPLAFFRRSVRRSAPALLAVSIAINTGMWLDRFIIIAGSLARDYLPDAWSDSGYRMTLVDLGILLGSLGFFLFCFLLFVRYLPVLPVAETKREYLRERREEEALRGASGGG